MKIFTESPCQIQANKNGNYKKELSSKQTKAQSEKYLNLNSIIRYLNPAAAAAVVRSGGRQKFPRARAEAGGARGRLTGDSGSGGGTRGGGRDAGAG